MEIAEYKKHLKWIADGNEDAFDYLMLMSNVFRIWDDLWDQDREVNKFQADEVFRKLTFDLSRNKFFEANRQALEAFVFVAWNAWQDSNEWQGDENKLKGLWAWFGRDYCNEIDVLVAWLVGGVDHARKVSLKTRELYLKQLASRGLDGFLKV